MQKHAIKLCCWKLVVAHATIMKFQTTKQKIKNLQQQLRRCFFDGKHRLNY